MALDLKGRGLIAHEASGFREWGASAALTWDPRLKYVHGFKGGYGIPALDGAVTATPHLGLGLSDTSRDYRLGWRLTSARKGGPDFTLGLDATRREALGADAGHSLMLRGTIRW